MIPTLLRIGRVCLLGGLLAACGSPPAAAPSPAPLQPTATPASPTATQQQAHAGAADAIFAGAQSISLAGGPDGAVYAAIGQDSRLLVAASRDGGAFSDPVAASGAIPALVSPIERPAIAAAADGRVAVAWLELADGGETVIWFAASADGGGHFDPPREVGRTTARETTMVSLAFAGGDPLVTWLQDGALVLSRAADGGATFATAQVVDDLVCECCQPAPLVRDGRILLAFRNLDRSGGDDVRDIYVASADGGGANFAPSRVSDSPWQIDACPISGPAIAAAGDDIYLAWMDARNDRERTGLRSDIWLARSADGGGSWSPNLRVTADREQAHTLPDLAIGPGGRIHLAWQIADRGDQSIVHVVSDDRGATFAPPATIASTADGRGRPQSAALLATPAGRIYLAWIDNEGARVRSWDE